MASKTDVFSYFSVSRSPPLTFSISLSLPFCGLTRLRRENLQSIGRLLKCETDKTEQLEGKLEKKKTGSGTPPWQALGGLLLSDLDCRLHPRPAFDPFLRNFC